MKRHKWLPEERQAHQDGVRNKAQTFADKRKRENKRACRGYKWRGSE